MLGDDMGEFWRDVRKARQEGRSINRESSPALLGEAGIAYTSRNDGAHLVVAAHGYTIDFWPGTGLWIIRGSTQRRRGVRNLIKFVQKGHP